MNKTIIPLLLILFFISINAATTKSDPAEKSNPPKLKLIAVMDFKNHTGQDEINQTCETMARLLASDLSGTPGIRALERDKIEAAMNEIELGEDGFTDPATAPKAQKALGSDFIVEGSISKKDKELIFKFQLISLKDGRVICSNEMPGKIGGLFEIETKIKNQLLDSIKPEPKDAPVKKPLANKTISIAVMPFEDTSPEKRSLSLSELMQYSIETELSRIEQVSLLTREYMSEILQEHKMQLSGLLDKKNALKLGKLAGVNYLSFGTVTLIDKTVRVDIRVVNVETGEIAFCINETKPLNKIEELQKQLSVKMLAGLDIYLLKGEIADINQQDEAAQEALYHLRQAIEMEEGNWSVVGKDEQNALQRALYLDRLDTGADLCLIDKMIEGQLFEEAARKVRKALLRKLPKEIEGELWHRLAQCYSTKGELPILWHIAKTYPDTPAACRAYWHLSNIYSNIVHDSIIAADCFKQATKDMATLKKVIPERELHNLADQARWFSNVKKRNPLDAFLNRQTPQTIYDTFIIIFNSKHQLDEIDLPQFREDVEAFCEYLEKFEAESAFKIYKKYGRYFSWKNHKCDLASIMTHSLLQEHLYDYALEVQKIRMDFEKDNPPDKSGFDRTAQSWINIIEQDKKLWEIANPEKCQLPDFNPDKIKQLISAVPDSNSSIARYVSLAIEKNPKDFKAAYEATLKAAVAEISQRMPEIDYARIKTHFILTYLSKGEMATALNFITTYYDGNNLDEKIKLLDHEVIKWFAQYHVQRLEYAHALDLYLCADEKYKKKFPNRIPENFFTRLSIMIYKLRDYNSALKILKKEFTDTLSKEKHYALSLDASKQSGRDVARYEATTYNSQFYLAAKCYEGLGDIKNAYYCYARFLKQYHDLGNVHSDYRLGDLPTRLARMKNSKLNAEERIMQLEELIIKQKLNREMWKAGDWWEGVQGWYASSPDSKKLPEGWIFTPLYFEIDRIEKLAAVDCFVLNIYNKTRDEIAAAKNKNDSIFVSVYVAKATYSVLEIKFGRACTLPRAWDSTGKLIMPFKEIIASTDKSVIPLADNAKLQPISTILFTHPFNQFLPDWLCENMDVKEETISIQNKPAECRKTTLSGNIDLSLLGHAHVAPDYSWLRYNKDNAPNFPYKIQQYWNDKYPWWLKVAEINRSYVEGKSPEYARYSKLFVLTKVNGNAVEVDTGLGDKARSINDLQKLFKDYETNYPFADVATRENEALIKLIVLMHGDDRRHVLDTLTSRKNMSLAFLNDWYNSLDINDEKKQCRALYILKNTLKDPDIMKKVEKVLFESKPELKELRTRLLERIIFERPNCGTRAPFPECFNKNQCEHTAYYSLLLKYLEFCEKHDYPDYEINTILSLLFQYNHYQGIPALLKYYRKTRNVTYLNYAYKISKSGTPKFPYWNEIIKPGIPLNDKEKYYKETEEWYNQNEAKESGNNK